MLVVLNGLKVRLSLIKILQKTIIKIVTIYIYLKLMLIESFMIFTMILSFLPERIKIEKVKKLVVANFHGKKNNILYT